MENEQLILNRYKPLSHAGSGGFGSVVVAWDTRIQRKVAIKTIQLTERDAARAALPGANAVSMRFTVDGGARGGDGAVDSAETAGAGRVPAQGTVAEAAGAARISRAAVAAGPGAPAGVGGAQGEPLPWESDEEYLRRTQGAAGLQSGVASAAGPQEGGQQLGGVRSATGPRPSSGDQSFPLVYEALAERAAQSGPNAGAVRGAHAPASGGSGATGAASMVGPSGPAPAPAGAPRPGQGSSGVRTRRYVMQDPKEAYAATGMSAVIAATGGPDASLSGASSLSSAMQNGSNAQQGYPGIRPAPEDVLPCGDGLGVPPHVAVSPSVLVGQRGSDASAPQIRRGGTLVMEGAAVGSAGGGDEAGAETPAVAVDPSNLELGPDGQPLVRALAHVPGLDEARTAATLNDESIVGVYDFEIRGTTAYLIMEYVEGLTLTQFIGHFDSSLTLDMIAAVLQAVSHALDVAHENGVLHLDIKPDNVLINAKGQVKVTDFGLATLADASGLGSAGGGTIGYMPLEQMRQQPLDARCDEWALASMMYWLLAGSNPFLARDLKGAEAAIENAELVLPSLCWEDMDPELDDVVFRALDPEVDERFDSVEEFAKALKPFLGSAKKGKKQLAELVEAQLSGAADEEDEDGEEAQAEEERPPREPGLPLCYRVTPWHRTVAAAVVGAVGSGLLAAVGWSLVPPTSGFASPLFWGLSCMVALVGALAPWIGALIACAVAGVGLVVAGAPALGIVLVAAGVAWGLYCGRDSSAQANAGLTFPLAGCAGMGMLSPLVAGFTARPVKALATTAFSCLLALTLTSVDLSLTGASPDGEGADDQQALAPSAVVKAPEFPLAGYDLPAVLALPSDIERQRQALLAPPKRDVEGVRDGQGADLQRAFDGVDLNDAGAATGGDGSNGQPVPHEVLGLGDGESSDASAPILPFGFADRAAAAPFDIQGAFFVQLCAPQTWAVVVSWLVAAAVLALLRLARSRALSVVGVLLSSVILGVGLFAAAFLATGGVGAWVPPLTVLALVASMAVMLTACAFIPLYGYTDDAVAVEEETPEFPEE